MNRMQHVHDALRRMRAEGEAWLTHEGERLRIRPLREEDLPPASSQPLRAVIRTKARGGVCFGDVWWHEWRLHTNATPTGGTRRGDDDVVLAVAVERHPVEQDGATRSRP